MNISLRTYDGPRSDLDDNLPHTGTDVIPGVMLNRGLGSQHYTAEIQPSHFIQCSQIPIFFSVKKTGCYKWTSVFKQTKNSHACPYI